MQKKFIYAQRITKEDTLQKNKLFQQFLQLTYFTATTNVKFYVSALFVLFMYIFFYMNKKDRFSW